jgi:hypothetical protein
MSPVRIVEMSPDWLRIGRGTVDGDLIEMRGKERDRLAVLRQVAVRTPRQRRLAERLGLTVRRVKPSNNRLAADKMTRIETAPRERYTGIALRGAKVTVRRSLDGRMDAVFKDCVLPTTTPLSQGCETVQIKRTIDGPGP